LPKSAFRLRSGLRLKIGQGPLPSHHHTHLPRPSAAEGLFNDKRKPSSLATRMASSRSSMDLRCRPRWELLLFWRGAARHFVAHELEDFGTRPTKVIPESWQACARWAFSLRKPYPGMAHVHTPFFRARATMARMFQCATGLCPGRRLSFVGFETMHGEAIFRGVIQVRRPISVAARKREWPFSLDCNHHLAKNGGGRRFGGSGGPQRGGFPLAKWRTHISPRFIRGAQGAC